MTEEHDLRDVFDLCCPACGQADELIILITTLARVTPDGSEPEGDHEWDDTSYCRCPDCAHTGTVANFTQTGTETEKRTSTQLESEEKS